MTVIVIGAVLLVAGVVYMAGAALRRGQLSDPHAESSGLMPALKRKASPPQAQRSSRRAAASDSLALQPIGRDC